VGLRLVVGLGNPGPKYERTRHNIGFRLVESLAGPRGEWKDFRGLGRTCKADGVMLAEPLTFMNESGRFVQAVASFYKIEPFELLVCYDEIALALGRLRLRPSGSSGGHNGMKSIIESLGGEGFPRLRVGVGPQPAGVDSAAWVLGRFSADEEKRLPDILEAAAEAVFTAATRGIDEAMNRFNPAADSA
jgi:PTH1 family peptidyl-tRNA hydrolase